jgi:hypothetical protein
MGQDVVSKCQSVEMLIYSNVDSKVKENTD